MTVLVRADRSSTLDAMEADGYLDAERNRIAVGLNDEVIHSMFTASLQPESLHALPSYLPGATRPFS